jgi:hypothetical protein
MHQTQVYKWHTVRLCSIRHTFDIHQDARFTSSTRAQEAEQAKKSKKKDRKKKREAAAKDGSSGADAEQAGSADLDGLAQPAVPGRVRSGMRCRRLQTVRRPRHAAAQKMTWWKPWPPRG